MGSRRARGGVLSSPRPVRIAAAALALVLAGASAAVGWVRSERGSSWLANRLETLLEDPLATGGIDVGAVELGVGVLTVRDVRIHGASHPDVVVVPEAIATIDLGALLDRRVEIAELMVVEPRVTLRRTADGHFDLPTPKPQPPSPGPPTFLPAGWTVDARLEARDVTVGLPDDGVQTTHGALRATLGLSHERITVSDGRLETTVAEPALGRVTATVGLALHHADLEQLTLVAASDGLLVDVTGSVPDALGAASLDLEAAVRANRPTWERWARALQIEPPALDVQTLAARATVEGSVSTPSVGADLFFADALGRAFDTPPVATVQAEVRGTSPLDVRLAGAIPRAAPWRAVGSPLESGKLTFVGRLDTDLTLAVTGHDVAASPLYVPRVDADVRLGLGASGTLAVDLFSDAIDIVTDAVVLPLAGEIGVTMRGASVDVQVALADRRDRARRLDAELVVHPASTTVRADSLVLHAAEGLSLAQVGPTVVDWSGPRVTTDLRGEVGRVFLDASFAEAWPRGRMAVDDLDLAGLRRASAPFVDTPVPAVSGLVSARLGTEDASHPWSLSVAGLDVEGAVHGLSASLAGVLESDRGTVEGTLLDAQGELVRLEATLPLAETGSPSSLTLACGSAGTRATLASEPRTLESLAALFGVEAPARAAEITSHLTLSGDPCDPDLHLEATAKPDLAGLEPTTHLDLRDGPDHAARALLHAVLGDTTRATVEATVHHAAPSELVEHGLDGVGSFVLDAELDGLPSEMWLPTAPGSLGGRLAFRGEGTHLEQVDGEVSFTPAGPTSPIPAGRLALATHEGVLDASVDFGGPEPTLTARVSLDDLHDRGLDTPLSAEVRGLVATVADLAALADVDVRRAAGEIRVDGPVGGTLRNPDPDLRVELVDGTAVLPALGVRYDDVNVLASLVGDTLTVAKGELSSRPRSRTLRQAGRGMRLSGTVVRDAGGVVRPDLVLSLDRSWLLAARSTTLQATGEVRLVRPEDAIRLEGTARVDEGRVFLDRSAFAAGGPPTLHPDIVFVDALPPTTFQATPTPSRSTLGAIDLDLDVDLGDGVALQVTVPLVEQADAVGRAFDVAVDGKLTGAVDVTQRDGVIDLRGRLAPTGRVQLLTARFDIDDGSVAFAGGDLTEPTIDLSLRREGSYGTVRARVQGTPSALELSELTSDESANQEDVVALLLFGRPLGEVDPETSGPGGLAVEQALLSVAGRQVEQAFGGSVVDAVDYNSEDGLSLGFALGGTGFLTVSVDPLSDEDDNTAQARLTWLLTRRLEVGLESGDTGASAGWIVWRRRF